MPDKIGSIPVLWTLQRYIFREMARTFVLTAAALTAILGLGGGVIEMVRLGEISPQQLGRLMLLVLPVAGALTLPVAALFSAAAAYGRISADNEFVACRSSGINLHVLFIPALALSLLSASITFIFSNFVIPGMVRNLNDFIRSDMASVIRQRLERPRGITLGGRIRLSAERNAVDASDPDKIVIQGIRFIELNGDDWVRYGTARVAELEFITSGEQPQIRGTLYGLSLYDRSPPRFFEEDVRVFPTQTIPSFVRRELKFLRLGELIALWRSPDSWHRVQTEMKRLRLAVGRRELFTQLWAEWGDRHEIELVDDSRSILIHSATGTLMPGASGIELFDATIEEQTSGGTRTGTAKRVLLEIHRGQTLADSGIGVDAFNVRLSDGSDWVERPKESFPAIDLPEDVVSAVLAVTDSELLRSEEQLAPDDPVSSRRRQAVNVREETIRRIIVQINERFAFSISVVVLVILGAALGIIFRGAHVMIAFGISFVPSLLIILGIVTGKQLAYNAPTFVVGLSVMWGVIGAVAALDVWIMMRVLRR